MSRRTIPVAVLIVILVPPVVLAGEEPAGCPVLLPEGYDAPENAGKRWPLCVLLPERGRDATGIEGLADLLGRRGVVYAGLPADAEPSPEAVAACVRWAREHHRVDDRPAVVVGHGSGATLAHRFALHRPDLLRAYFACGGRYRGLPDDDEGLAALKERGVRPCLAHCEGDPAAEVRETRLLSERLSDRGIEHDCLIVRGGNHSLTTKIARAAQEFVARLCRGEELPPLAGELVVAAVDAGSAAEAAGLAPGDVILSYNGRPVANRDDLRVATSTLVWGQEEVVIRWRRGEEEMEGAAPPGPLGAVLLDR